MAITKAALSTLRIGIRYGKTRARSRALHLVLQSCHACWCPSYSRLFNSVGPQRMRIILERLNGWQRLWVVTSFLWGLLVAFLAVRALPAADLSVMADIRSPQSQVLRELSEGYRLDKRPTRGTPLGPCLVWGNCNDLCELRPAGN